MSFLDDVGNFFSKDVPKFVNDNKGTIEGAAAIVASAYGGPAAGTAVSTALTAALGSDQQKADAQKKLATTSPAAVAAASAATQHVTAGAIIASKVDAASKGDEMAKAQLQDVAAKAAAGDPSAIAALDAAQKIAAANVKKATAPKSNIPILAAGAGLAGLLAAILL